MARSTTKAPINPGTTTKTATPKPGTAPKRISRIPAPPKRSDIDETEDGMARIDGPELKKQELVQKVFDRCDSKKKDVKPVVDAVLEILGEALAEGRELNLPPLGKLKVNRVKQTAAARIIIAKIRQGTGSGAKAEASDADPLAAIAE